MSRRRKLINKVKEFLFVSILVLLLAGVFLYMIFDACTLKGYYAPEYLTEDGRMLDIDGDGEYWQWIEPDSLH